MIEYLERMTIPPLSTRYSSRIPRKRLAQREKIFGSGGMKIIKGLKIQIPKTFVNRYGEGRIPALTCRCCGPEFRVIAKSIFLYEPPFEFNEFLISRDILAITLIQHYLDGLPLSLITAFSEADNA